MSSATKTTATATRPQQFWQSPRFQKRALLASAVVLVAGAIVFAVAYFRNTGSTLATPLRNVPPTDVSKVPKTVKLEPGAKNVARQFVITAVGRTNLRRAWAISGPHIRQGMSLKEWLTGTIPVIPYPADAIGIAPMKIDYSYANKALLEVALLPKPGFKIRPTIFFVNLIRVGPSGKKHWLVDGWTPRVPVQIPSDKS